MAMRSEQLAKPLRPKRIGEFLLSTITHFQNVYAGLSLDSPVVPGQPIPISVSFWSYDHALDFGTGCYIKIYLVENTKTTEIFSYPKTPGKIQPYSVVVGPQAVRIDDVEDFIDPPAGSTALGKRLFAQGDHLLRLEITTDGKDQGPYSAEAVLTVVLESLDERSWIWGDLRYRDGFFDPGAVWFWWKEAYWLYGFCANYSQANIGMDFKVTLNEIDDAGTSRVAGSLFPRLPANGGSPMLQFPSITQDWKWLEEVVWLVVGPLHRTFLYRVAIDVVDDYGNQYPTFLSAPLALTINVSDKKQRLAEAAAGTGWPAIALTVISIFWPWAGIGAAALGIASQILGVEALDPPKPDKRFLDIVEPRPFSLPRGMSRDSRLAPLSGFVGTIGEVVSCMNALGRIESKLMGARASGSRKGITLQKQSYRRVIRHMVSAANRLSATAELASQSLVEAGLFENADLNAMISGRTKVPISRITGQLRKFGFKGKSITRVEELLGTPRLRRALLSAETTTRLLRWAAIETIAAVLTARREVKGTLQRYTPSRNRIPTQARSH